MLVLEIHKTLLFSLITNNKLAGKGMRLNHLRNKSVHMKYWFSSEERTFIFLSLPARTQ